MTQLKITDQTTMEMANSIRELIEGGVRWMFQVGAEREWFVFAGAVAGLWLLSLVGNYFDLLTLLYIGNINLFLFFFSLYISLYHVVNKRW